RSIPCVSSSALASGGMNRIANLASESGTFTRTFAPPPPPSSSAASMMTRSRRAGPFGRGGVGAVGGSGAATPAGPDAPRALRRLAASSTEMVPAANMSRTRRRSSLSAMTHLHVDVTGGDVDLEERRAGADRAGDAVAQAAALRGELATACLRVADRHAALDPHVGAGQQDDVDVTGGRRDAVLAFRQQQADVDIACGVVEVDAVQRIGGQFPCSEPPAKVRHTMKLHVACAHVQVDAIAFWDGDRHLAAAHLGQEAIEETTAFRPEV